MPIKLLPGSYGELDYPDNDSSRAFLLNRFLKTLSEIGQHVLNDLYDGPFQYYLKHVHKLKLDWSDLVYYSQYPEVEALRETLNSWAMDHNLNADWCVERLFDTCRTWAIFPNRPSRLRLIGDGWGGVQINDETPIPEGLELYNPIMHRRSDYLERVRQQIHQTFDDHPLLSIGDSGQRQSFVESVVNGAISYCQSVEGFYISQGYVRAEESGHVSRNLAWAVRFQVTRQSFTEIAKSEDVDVTTVKGEVDKILSKLNLTKRQGERGRKLGQKDASQAQRRRAKKKSGIK